MKQLNHLIPQVLVARGNVFPQLMDLNGKGRRKWLKNKVLDIPVIDAVNLSLLSQAIPTQPLNGMTLKDNPREAKKTARIAKYATRHI